MAKSTETFNSRIRYLDEEVDVTALIMSLVLANSLICRQIFYVCEIEHAGNGLVLVLRTGRDYIYLVKIFEFILAILTISRLRITLL